VFVGIENLLRGDIPKARRMVPFGFGLIHGFGFASALREAGIGSGPGGLLLPPFSFNLGVGLGQIMVAAVALPIIWKLRENPMFITRWAPVCSAAVVLLGSFWFVQRVWMTWAFSEWLSASRLVILHSHRLCDSFEHDDLSQELQRTNSRHDVFPPDAG